MNFRFKKNEIKCSLIVIILFLLTVNLKIFAQNLVPNGSFEQVYKPSKSRYSGNIEHALPWFPAGIGSPDLINQGNYNYGFKKAFSGTYYAGIILFDADNKEFREYLSVKLLNKLEINKTYTIKMSVAAAKQSFYYTDELGISFTPDSLISNDWNTISVVPNLKTERYKALNDTVKWKMLEWNYTASGDEQFITIGNFRNDINTNLQTSGISSSIRLAYIYIDDIKITPYIAKTDTIKPETIIKENPLLAPSANKKVIVPNVITPNNDGFNDYFMIENLPSYTQLAVINKKGVLVYSSNNYKNNWNGDDLPTGNYKYELKLPDGNIIYGSLDIVKK
jgi:gliding motility-associated-like protein